MVTAPSSRVKNSATVKKLPAKKAATPRAPAAAKPVVASAPGRDTADLAQADKKSKPEKVKVVRDSFTIPKSEYLAITTMKKRALAMGSEVKKSELIRAGLMLLSASTDAAFKKALSQVPTLKTGRPGKV